MKKKILLIEFVLMLGILFSSFGLLADEVKFFEVSRDEVSWEPGVVEKLYVITAASAFYIRDSDGNVTSKFEYFKSGTVKAASGGVVEMFEGVVGDVGSSLVINGEKYRSLPAGAKFKYDSGEVSVDMGKEGGEFFYEGKGAFGEIDPTNKITAEGSVNVKNGVLSSNKPFEISGPSGDIGVEPVGGKNAEIGLDSSGGISSMENANVNFRDDGFLASGSDKTSVFHDGACERGGNYLCLDSRAGTEKLISGGNSAPSIEMTGPNKYFQGEDGDYLKLSKDSVFGGGKPGEIIVEKDRLTVEGKDSWEIVNGEDKLRTGADGNIRSSKLINPKGNSMPMEVYTSQDGSLGKYYVEVDGNGLIDTKKVGLLEKGKYLIHRGGVYDMPEDLTSQGFVFEEVSEAVESNLFDGNFKSGEKVEGYVFCDKEECLQMGKNYREFGTMKQALLFEKCQDFGVGDCLAGGDHTSAIRQLYNNAAKSDSYYIRFTTDTGRVEEFGNQMFKRS